MNFGVELIQNNIHFVQQGIDLLEDIDDKQYTDTDSPYYQSGVGVHMRHILDHYLSLVDHDGAKIDYDDRERDDRIESDRAFAISVSKDIINQLNTYLDDPDVIDKNVKVRSNEGESEAESPWSGSTVQRELQFLISHTVHHFALIAVILRIQGYHPPDEFGVAPSTLQYRKQKQTVEQGK